jgi:hypothetical protein
MDKPGVETNGHMNPDVNERQQAEGKRRSFRPITVAGAHERHR